MEEQLRFRSPWLVEPSHVAAFTCYEIAVLFMASISSGMDFRMIKMLRIGDFCENGVLPARLHSSGRLLQALFYFYASFYGKVPKRTWYLLRPLSGFQSAWITHCLTKASLLMAITPIMKRGFELYRKSTNTEMAVHDIAQQIFPSDRYENVVVSSCVESLILSTIKVTSPSSVPVILMPNIVLYPHSIMVPFFLSRNINIEHFDVDLQTYCANLKSLSEKIRRNNDKGRKIFVILPSILGRCIQNAIEICTVARQMQAFSIEIRVPTVEMCPEFTTTASSSFRLRSVDTSIVSFRTVSCLDGAVGSFRSTDIAESCRDHKFSNASPVLALWIELVNELVRCFLSNRLGFGLAIRGVVCLCRLSDVLFSRRTSQNSETQMRTACRSVRELLDRGAWVKVAGYNNKEKPHLASSDIHHLQIGSALTFLSRYRQDFAVYDQIACLWGLLTKLRPGISVVSVNGGEKPLESTEAFVTGIIIRAVKPNSLVSLLLKEGFDSFQLTGRSIDSLRKDKISKSDFVYCKSSLGKATPADGLVFISLNARMSTNQQEHLLTALNNAPRNIFSDLSLQDYCTEEVRYLLHIAQTNRPSVHIFSKL